MTGAPRQRQDGSIALEAVLALPLVALVLATVLGTTTVVVDQLAATRAARAAARTMAVTGDPDRARAVVAATAPSAEVIVTVRASVATVRVLLTGDLAGVGYAVDATAAAPLEPATTGGRWP